MTTAAFPTPASTAGPITQKERALAPDLARGAMLLLIALANATFYLWGAPYSGISEHPASDHLADQIVQFVIITMVDMRTYPMFAFLFGYGIVQIFQRQLRAGSDVRTARRLLRRRHWWLVAFGFAHAALLWMGDVLGAYGIAGLVIGSLFLLRQSKTLIIWASIFVGLLAVGAISATVLAALLAGQPGEVEASPALDEFFDAPFAAESYLLSMAIRLLFWTLIGLGQGLLSLVVPVMLLLAFWAARHQVLERPGEHLPLLRRTVVIGLIIGWGGGLPQALAQVGIFEVPEHVAWVFYASHPFTGLFAGLAYVAAFTLMGHRLTGRPQQNSLPIRALQAVGQRSLSCYLAQSVLFAPVLCAWGLGLGEHLSSATVAAYAIGVWLITVVAALLLARANRRGPAEVLLRRLVYRPQQSVTPPPSPTPPTNSAEFGARPS